MKLTKYLSIAALLVVSLAAQLNAQTLAGNIAGSSALWLEAGQGVYAAGAPNSCSWTSSGTSNYYVDSRVTGPPPANAENGNLWVVWTTGSTGTCASPSADAIIYTYMNLDSTLGNRCLFATPSCTLQLPSADSGSAGANLLTGITDTTLSSVVYGLINNQPETIAATDIMPVDSKFATYSALAVCGPLSAGTQYIGLGYGPGPVGQQVNSFYSTKFFHVFDFNVYGNDPITNSQVAGGLGYTITPVGATPVLVAVNTTDTAIPAFAGATNVTRGTLGLIFGGLLVRTADINPTAFAGTSSSLYAGLTALIREPLSGTYNTFDHSIPNNKEIYRSMDSGNCTNGLYNPGNPMNLARAVGGTTGFRNRVIGTGEMISKIATVQDAIGFAFWSAANFGSGKISNSNAKYLTVDGVDPLLHAYTTGQFPQTATQLAAVTLEHVADGSYPIWSEQRYVTLNNNSAATSAAAVLATDTQSQVSFGSGATQPDFIPAPQLLVFHSHFAPSFINFNSTNTPSDGQRVCGAGASPEDGGDVGGLVFAQQAGADYCVLKGNYNSPGSVGNPNGPTNEASFGIRQ
jgi:hypothetical protein